MLAVNLSSYCGFAAHILFFILFCIKMYWLITEYIIPFLAKHREEASERWFSLQERHLVLVAKKKQLATQFLQQEKQIALLSAKLEAWHFICRNKALEKEREIAARSDAMHERATIQQYTVARRELVKKTAEAVLVDIRSRVTEETEDLFAQYLARAQVELSGVEKKDTLYESSYAKKTEGA